MNSSPPTSTSRRTATHVLAMTVAVAATIALLVLVVPWASQTKVDAAPRPSAEPGVDLLVGSQDAVLSATSSETGLEMKLSQGWWQRLTARLEGWLNKHDTELREIVAKPDIATTTTLYVPRPTIDPPLPTTQTSTTLPSTTTPSTTTSAPTTAPTSTSAPTTTTPSTTTPSTTTPPTTGPATTAPPTTSPPTTAPPTTAPATTAPPQTSTTAVHQPNVYRLTVGSDRSTEFDDIGAPQDVSSHGVRIYCPVSHFSHDDPIVHPGSPGAAHAHMFWGNTETNAHTSSAELINSGNSSCEGGTKNRSAYWAPALFNDAAEVVIPESIFVYYKSFGGPGFDRTTLKPIPVGLEMLASRNVANAGPWHFKVGGNQAVQLSIGFPQCLQVDASGAPVLSSQDNTSHLSYASGGGPTDCPASHPYRIPQLIYIIRYDIPFSSNWSLASDSPGSAKGHSLHADYIAAWDTAVMDQLVECNIVARRNCGFGGGRGQLPERFLSQDGRQIYRYSATLEADADRTPFGTSITPYSNSHGGSHG